MGVGKGSLGWDWAVCWWRLALSKVVGSAEEARTVNPGLWKPEPQPSEAGVVESTARSTERWVGLRSPLRREGDLWWEEEGKREGRRGRGRGEGKKRTGGGIRRVVVGVLVDLIWLVGFC